MNKLTKDMLSDLNENKEKTTTVVDIKKMKNKTRVKKCIVKIIKKFPVHTEWRIRFLVDDNSNHNSTPLNVVIKPKANILTKIDAGNVIIIKNALKYEMTKAENGEKCPLLIVDKESVCRKAPYHYRLKFKKIGYVCPLPLKTLMENTFDADYIRIPIHVKILDINIKISTNTKIPYITITVADGTQYAYLKSWGCENVNFYKDLNIGKWYSVQNFFCDSDSDSDDKWKELVVNRVKNKNNINNNVFSFFCFVSRIVQFSIIYILKKLWV